ncbi:MAG TPA: ATP-binding cassette domain-containing protein [Vicinamibacterales bacterium]|nr:ATP-binding cassette domain-containing protein [Vicinamibacterales bacterium]
MSLLEIRGLVKNYQGLRPLRIRELTVTAGSIVSIAGLDAIAAETFVHLLTGATLPDEGEVITFGQDTRTITDVDAWLRSLDRIGMVTARGVLIEAFSVLQNIAMSFTLDVDPVDPRVVPQAGALAREVGIDASMLDLPAGKVPPEMQMRVHLARALALGPQLLIAEHPSAALPRPAVAAFGADLINVAQSRGLALIAITADEVLAKAIAGQRLELVPATGELRAPGLLKKLFG